MKGGVRRANGSQCIYDFYSSERSKTGRLFSPRYPQHYPPHANCQFFFYALPHEKVQVTFDSIELEVTTGRLAVGTLNYAVSGKKAKTQKLVKLHP